jgi:hypothetical protein
VIELVTAANNRTAQVLYEKGVQAGREFVDTSCGCSDASQTFGGSDALPSAHRASRQILAFVRDRHCLLSQFWVAALASGCSEPKGKLTSAGLKDTSSRPLDETRERSVLNAAWRQAGRIPGWV